MELPCEIIEQIAFNTRPEVEEQMLIAMDKSTHEERLFQPLQTNVKQFKIVVTFPSGYNDIFLVRNKSTEIIFISVFDRAGYNVSTIPPGASELESLNAGIKRNNIEGKYITEEDSPFKIKPNYSTLGSIIEIELEEDGKSVLYKTLSEEILCAANHL